MTSSAKTRAPAACSPWPMPWTATASLRGPAECLREGNALTLETNRQPTRLHPGRSRAIRRRSDPQFDRELFARLAGPARKTRRPVFVFGLPRSGTTLIEQMLASHSQVHGAGELRLARRSFEAIPGVLGRSGATARLRPVPRPPGGLAPGRAASRAPGRDRRRPQPRDRRQDAGQLHVYRPAVDHVSARRRSSTAAATCATSPFRAG